MFDPKLTRGYGTLAGLGFIGTAILVVPSTLLIEPLPAAYKYLTTVAALFTGCLCFALPWERIHPQWLHALGVVAAIEIAVAVAAFGQLYASLYVVVAVAVAYISAKPRYMAAHLAVISIAALGPVVWGPEDARSSLLVALVILPPLVLASSLFSYLRLRLVADHRSYRQFAEQTLLLASRISGHAVTPPPGSTNDLELPGWSERYRIPTRVAATLSAMLAVPLLTAGLAAAGVILPGFAHKSFSHVGIDLPNQVAGGRTPEDSEIRRVEPVRRSADARGGAVMPVPKETGPEAPPQSGEGSKPQSPPEVKVRRMENRGASESTPPAQPSPKPQPPADEPVSQGPVGDLLDGILGDRGSRGGGNQPE